MQIKVATPEAYRLFHQGTLALAQVEANGFQVDVNYLNGQLEEIHNGITSLKEELRSDELFALWRREFGKKTNLGSIQQLGTILFDRMGYESKGRTATFRKKVDEATLQEIDLPFVKSYIQLRKLVKIKSTYVEGLLREADEDGIVHPFINLAGGGEDEDGGGPATYRSSSAAPNSQNFPKRNKQLAAIVRRGIIPRKGRYGVEMDFKGVEVGIAACYNEDPVLIDYVKHSPPKDMHRDTAMKVFMLKEKQVDKLTRDIAKNQMVFPQFYGSYYCDCAKALWDDITRLNLRVGGDGASLLDHLREKGIKKLGACDPESEPRKNTFEWHVREQEREFWSTFSVYDKWRRDWYKQYLRRGWFDMKTGFVCTFSKKGIPLRNDVINYPVQGSAFHCLLWCLIQLQEWLRKNRMLSLIIGQVHDSLWLDCVKSEIHEVIAKAQEIMTVDLPKFWRWIIVPLKVEVEVTKRDGNWFEKEEYHEGKLP